MSNDVMEKPRNLPTGPETEADNILTAAEEGAGFEKLLKFKKGKYYIGDNEVPLGRQYVAHTTQWVKCWIKFADGKVADRRMGKVAEGYVPPERHDLGDLDKGKWQPGLDGKLRDPWTFQHLLPMEDVETGEVSIFTTPSIGGHIAVADLCKAYAKRAKKGLRGLPILRLGVFDMPTKAYGLVPRPDFIIESWEESGGGLGDMTNTADGMNDKIPFLD
jgi:hypothetical protein